MSLVLILKLVFILIFLVVLITGTVHSAKKSEDSIHSDKLPPNSYPDAYFGYVCVEDDPSAYDVEAPDPEEESEELIDEEIPEEPLNPGDSE
ncbi:MAG: hypothetical protein K5634_04620 [Sphaerochaetaceae bacterium]|nr:hypothetical protein [Sphaerochaetaceae bacterium]